MAQYQVLLAVGARPVPTMNSTSKYQVAAGYTFSSSVTQADTTYGVPTLVQLPDGNWVPLLYNGKQYCQEITTPPASGSVNFTLSVDGFQTFTGTLIPL